MQTATAPGAGSRTFLIHMFMRGLDDNRYVVERYKSTFDGEIVRWPCKGKSKTGKQPRQVMSLSAVQRMRPERDEIIVCTGLKIAGSGIQYWGSAATGLFAERQAQGALSGLPPEMSPPADRRRRSDGASFARISTAEGRNMPYKDP